MNCKKGDRAICVRSVSGNEGRVCTVLELATTEELREVVGFANLILTEPVWRTDTNFHIIMNHPLYGYKEMDIPYQNDNLLLPLPDLGEEDHDQLEAGLPADCQTVD